MKATAQQRPKASSFFWRFVRYPLIRALLGIFLVALAGGLTLTHLEKLAGRMHHVMGSGFFAAAVVLLTYILYVRVIERRWATEVSFRGALLELLIGLLTGVVLVGCVAALIAAVGAYRITGMNPWSIAIIEPLVMMTFVGVLEEVISRALIFRITEESFGSWTALGISSAVFGLAHLPGESTSALAIINTVVAGVMFAAAYMVTRRIWLAVGIHVAWNYTLGSIFSVAVSGRDAEGLLVGTTYGSDLLSGGVYGFEASVVTLGIIGTLALALLRIAFVRGHFAPQRRLSAPGTQSDARPAV